MEKYLLGYKPKSNKLDTIIQIFFLRENGLIIWLIYRSFNFFYYCVSVQIFFYDSIYVSKTRSCSIIEITWNMSSAIRHPLWVYEIKLNSDLTHEKTSTLN